MVSDTLDTGFCIFPAHVNSIDFKVELVRQLSRRRLFSRLIGPQTRYPSALTIYEPTVLGLSDRSGRTAHTYIWVWLYEISLKGPLPMRLPGASDAEQFAVQGGSALVLNPFDILGVKLCNGM